MGRFEADDSSRNVMFLLTQLIYIAPLSVSLPESTTRDRTSSIQIEPLLHYVFSDLLHKH